MSNLYFILDLIITDLQNNLHACEYIKLIKKNPWDSSNKY